MRQLWVPLFLVFSVACAKPADVHIRSNATWSTNGASVLLVETRYETNEPDAPWFHSPNGTNWRTVFLRADAELSNVKELATFPEGDVGQGGGVQSAALYWLEPERVVVGLVDHAATAFVLDTGRRVEFLLPEAEKARLFERPDIDLRDTAAPVAVVPSPDATRVAVFHSAPYFGAGGFTDLRFVHAVSIHKLDGTFERAVALTGWDDTEEDLNLDLPPPAPPLPNPEPGEGFSAWSLVPAHFNTRMLWTKDSKGLFFVDVDRDDGGVVVEALAWRVDVEDGTHVEVTEVPARAVPTRGGGVSPDGRMLVVFGFENDPNAHEIRLFELADWVPFDDVGTVAVTEAVYAR